MSDNWMIFIPEEAGRQPTLAAADAAAELLREKCPRCDEVVVKFTEQLEFVHPYENWEGVKCPACKADLEDALFDADEAVAESGDVTCTTPCCGLKTTWQDLDYGWPAGFARFSIEVMNPKLNSLQPKEIFALTEILGMPLRQIWQHL